MTAEEYANNLVNKIDKSSYSQNKKNKFPHFDAYDLADAFDAGQEEMKRKAINSFCNVSCIDSNSCSKKGCPVYDRFIELLNK